MCYNSGTMDTDSKAEFLWSEVLNNPWVLGGVLVCFIAAIVAFFTPRVVGLLSLVVASALWLLALVMAKSLRGRSDRWFIIGRAWLVCAVVFAVIGYAGVRWGLESWAEATKPKGKVIPLRQWEQENRDPQRPPVATPEREPEAAMPHALPKTNHKSATPKSPPAPMSVPPKEASEASAPRQQVQPPPQPPPEEPTPTTRELIASYERVTSNYPDAPNAVRIIVQTTVSMPQTSLVVACDGKIAHANVRKSSPISAFMETQEMYTPDGPFYVFSSTSAFEPETPLIVTLSSKMKIDPTWVAIGHLTGDAITLASRRYAIAPSKREEGHP